MTNASSKWALKLSKAVSTQEQVGSNRQKLSQHKIKLVFSCLLQNREPVPNVLPTTGSAELYFTLNPLAAGLTGHWYPAALP